MLSPVLFSSNSGVWSTPQALFDKLDAEFGFTVDVAASPDNAKCQRYYTEAQDGLEQPWDGVAWCNPPYGRGIDKWVSKAVLEASRGNVVVMLVPARVDTRWWFELALQAAEIRFLRGRLRFSDAGSAPFPSAVLVFRPPTGTGWVDAPIISWWAVGDHRV